MYDTIIAGGGPAGSSTASFLRMRGRNVLVLEKEQFPRFHLGESLLPFGIDIFKELGVFDEIDRRYIHKPGARFVHEESGGEFTYYFDTAIRTGRPYAYQVPRGDFDLLLLDNSRRLGAEVRERHAVRDVKFHPDKVVVTVRDPEGKEYREEAPMLVDATGRDTFLANELGLKKADELVTTNVACFSHWENTKREGGVDEGNITIVLFDGGWWWFIPFKGAVTSVGVVFEKSYTMARKGQTPAQLYEGAIASQREIARLLDGATRVLPIDSTGNWSYRARQYYGDRFLLVGDSAAFIDPLFSTGVLMATTSGKYAAEAIDEALKEGDFGAARFASYQEKSAAGADLFLRLVHEFYGENLRPLLMESGASPTMCAVITSMLAGDVYNKAVWQTVLRPGFSRQAHLAQGMGRRARSSRQAQTDNKDGASE